MTRIYLDGKDFLRLPLYDVLGDPHQSAVPFELHARAREALK